MENKMTEQKMIFHPQVAPSEWAQQSAARTQASQNGLYRQDAEHDACHILSLGEVFRLLSEVAFDDVGGLDGGHDVAPWSCVGLLPKIFSL